jgi:hypothetical protein
VAAVPSGLSLTPLKINKNDCVRSENSKSHHKCSSLCRAVPTYSLSLLIVLEIQVMRVPRERIAASSCEGTRSSSVAWCGHPESSLGRHYTLCRPTLFFTVKELKRVSCPFGFVHTYYCLKHNVHFRSYIRLILLGHVSAVYGHHQVFCLTACSSLLHVHTRCYYFMFIYED